MNARRDRLVHVVATLLLAGLVAYAVCRWWFPFRTVVRPWQMNAEWIAPPGEPASEASFRHTVTIPGEVRNAWIAIAGTDSFELSVNGRTLSTQAVSRATSPFQRTLTEPGQQIITSPAMFARQRPREYQWSGFRSWRVPVFVDLTRHLRTGRNVICISVESRTTSPRLCAEGEALLRSGGRIAIRSGREWKASALPPRVAGIEWTHASYLDEDWQHAVFATPPVGGMLRTFDPGVFREPFTGEWMRSPLAAEDRPVTFETTWRIDGRPEEAWVRVLANRGYDLAINGRPVRSVVARSSAPRNGAWLLDSAPPHAAPPRAERLDPDEADSLPDEAVSPLPLTRNQEVAAFDLYSIRWLLRRGDNTISVRLTPTSDALHWHPRTALDAKVIDARGAEHRLISGDGWRCRVDGASARAIASGLADVTGAQLPRKIYAGNAWDVADKLRCWAITSLLAMGIVAMAARRASASLVTFPAALLFLAVLVESSWMEREEALLFLHENAWGGILAAVACVTPLAFLAKWKPATSPHVLWSRLALVWLLLLCAFLRARDLHFQALDPDEYASVQAIFSIARTGAPQLYDTVFYTRSPLYHYLVGGIVAVFGENIWALRLPSVFFAVATTALLYLIGARLLHSRWTGLVAAALYTIHPFAAFSGYLVRFYQQQQFFALLTVYLFCRGFVVGQAMRDRYFMLAAFFATVLSQELSLTIGCSLLIGYMLFAERKSWAAEIRFAVASGCVLLLVFLDLVIFQTRCLTRVDGTSPSLEPSLALNLESPSNLLMIFAVFSRLHLALSVLLLLSLPLVLRQRDRAALALHVLFFSGIVITAVFVTGTGLRYQYWLIPLWIVLGVHGVRALATFLLESAPVPRRALAASLVGAVVLTWSPWKLLDSHTTQLQTDSTGALSYVRRHARPGDAIMVSAPHTQSTLLEIGRIDYDLAIPLLHDFFYRKDGRLIDRNAGAEAIRHLDGLQEKCAEHERMWVLVNREDILRSTGRDIRWQLPGARTDLFLRTNLDLAHRTYLWDVFLWDRSAGRFHAFRQNR